MLKETAAYGTSGKTPFQFAFDGTDDVFCAHGRQEGVEVRPSLAHAAALLVAEARGVERSSRLER